MVSLPPKHVLSISKKESAAILALASIHVCAVAAVVFGESRFPQLVGNLAMPFLYCQLGLLAWWSCLAGPRRFWRIVLSLIMLALLIALASRRMIIEAGISFEGGEWISSPNRPWNQFDWLGYFTLIGGSLTLTAPFSFAAFVILGWIVPCKMTHRHGPCLARAKV